VNVDMATYKAEFLAHYYARRQRPREAYAFGLMPWWARLAALAPSAANAAAQTPVLRDIGKALSGMAPQREIPLFAPRTFRQWFASRTGNAPRRAGTQRVLLWPDTWNNHFHPTTAQAAVQVLEDAGFDVVIPKIQLCCGRPLYDYGMLDLAKTLLRGILDELRAEIRAGVPVVGLEPSCVSVFRDEMNDLLGPDEDARRLQRQTYLLTEFLAAKAPDYRPPPLRRKALVHAHCHHKAILDRSAETRLFDALHLEYDAPETGCCGMAGAFGFERKHYDVSLKVGERVLLPKVRSADDRTLIVADGFSCREQIAQCTPRQALHPAQVLKMAIDDRNAEHGQAREDSLPELRFMSDVRRERAAASSRGIAAVALLAAACGTGAFLALQRR
ncbi:MAG: FAD-binding oxidoreductase, partial [Candidatus Eremiobacteraeota bacterium]|nr:FAD-binding oxidoreductase [Candidatus Eremiobacteraeota bacterium]